MEKVIVKTDKAPAAIGPYSQGIKAGNLLFISGQLPVDPVSGSIGEGIEAQVEQSIKNLESICNETGIGLDAVVKTTVFIKNMEDFAKMNQVYQKYFGASVPARACVEVARLPLDVLVEIEAVALVE